jgi:mono/diheme cytochrome c family protein
MRRILLDLAIAVSLIWILTLALPASSRAQSDTEKVYKTNCVLCHAADGSGNSASGKALGAKNLASDEVQKKSDAELTDLMTKGKGKMPAFGKKLKPEDITQLVAFVRKLAKK